MASCAYGRVTLRKNGKSIASLPPPCGTALPQLCLLAHRPLTCPERIVDRLLKEPEAGSIIETSPMLAAQAATRLEAIRNSLAARAGIRSDAKGIAAGTESIWRDVAAQLAPVIGHGGLEVLFGRALHQTTTRYPWLAGVIHDASAPIVPATLTPLLASQEVDVAREAGSAVLMHFAELLAALIGEPLARRLLAPVWALRPPATDLERQR